MNVIKEISNIYEIEENSWAGAKTVLNDIIEKDREDDAWNIINEYMNPDYTCGDTPTETELNDFIWFELADIMDLYNDNEEDDNND